MRRLGLEDWPVLLRSDNTVFLYVYLLFVYLVACFACLCLSVRVCVVNWGGGA